MTFAFLKGHGTRNDFVLLPDLDGTVHDDLDPTLVQKLCDRRSGIGADGVLRVLRGDVDGGAEWFMDYRNADGSIAEMCGNGIRVFARYLAQAGLVEATGSFAVDTRDGVKQVSFVESGEISVDMGVPRPGGPVEVKVDGRPMTATFVDLGNPHAVVLVSSLDEAGRLLDPPLFDTESYTDGLNIEFAQPRGPAHLAMRVYERGVGETQSCGTGACAAVVATQVAEQTPERDGTPYQVDVPGGTLTVTWADDGRIHLQGPAAIVAEGVWRD